jgi:hypothetical protein
MRGIGELSIEYMRHTVVFSCLLSYIHTVLGKEAAKTEMAVDFNEI